MYTAVSRKVVGTEAYAAIPKGFMGNGFLPFSDRISRCFSPQEGESMNIRTQAISVYRAKSRVRAKRTSIKQQQLINITHKAIRHWRIYFY